VENIPKNKSMRSKRDASERINELQDEINTLRVDEDEFNNFLDGLEKKKELGSNLFLLGSILLFVGILNTPICTTSAGIIAIVCGIGFYVHGRTNGIFYQELLSETEIDISKSEKELKAQEDINNKASSKNQ
jgi:hypothetical protein